MSKHVKQIVCGGCDLYCGLLAHVDVEKNQVVKIAPNPPPLRGQVTVAFHAGRSVASSSCPVEPDSV